MQAVRNPLSRQRVRQIAKVIKVLRIGLGQNDFAGFEILIKVSEQFSEAAVSDLAKYWGLGRKEENESNNTKVRPCDVPTRSDPVMSRPCDVRPSTL